MIEAIPGATQKAVEAMAGAAKEGLRKVGMQEVGMQEVGRSDAVGNVAKLAIGGDASSVLCAMEVEPEALGAEVRSTGPGVEVTEQVPLKDSKGEVRHLLSPQEAAHYENIGLRAQGVNGRECLVRDDIDWRQRDGFGQTNRERAEQGLAPLDPEGRPYELHHVQQRSDGMLAELTRDEHRGAGVDRILHDPTKTSEIDRAEFDQIRADHWRARAAEVQS